MTGFGRAVAPLDDAAVVVQVNSVNRRSLDLSIRLPEAWAPLESRIADKVREVTRRGKVHLQVGLEAQGGSDGQAAAYLQRLAQVAADNQIEFKPNASLLWNIVNDRRPLLEPELAAGVEVGVLDAVDHALRGLCAMRAKEGEALLIDFLTRIDGLKSHVKAVAARAPQVPAAYRQTLLQRLRDADLKLDIGDERVLREVALFADRCAITEELTRLDSHLHQFETHVRGENEIGRKAEFMLQEMGREVHTIGSKANDLEISQRVIELKYELECIREQIANVE